VGSTTEERSSGSSGGSSGGSAGGSSGGSDGGSTGGGSGAPTGGAGSRGQGPIARSGSGETIDFDETGPRSNTDSSGTGDDSGGSTGSESSSGTGSDSGDDTWGVSPEEAGVSPDKVVTEEGAPSIDNPVVEHKLRQANQQLSEQGYDREDYNLRVTDAGTVKVAGLTDSGQLDVAQQQVEQQYRDAPSYSIEKVNEDAFTAEITTEGGETKTVNMAFDQEAAEYFENQQQQQGGVSEETASAANRGALGGQTPGTGASDQSGGEQDGGSSSRYQNASTLTGGQLGEGLRQERALTDAREQLAEKVDQEFENTDLQVGEDFTISQENSKGGQTRLTAELTDQGRKDIAKANAPLQNTPLEGVTEWGAGVNEDYEEFRRGLHSGYDDLTAPVEETFNKNTPDTQQWWNDNTPDMPDVNIDGPSAGQVLGASAVATAAPEPASSVSGVVVGGATLTALGALSLAQNPDETQTTAETSVQQDQPEIPADGNPTQQQSEVPADGNPTQQSPEIGIPEAGGATSSEMGVPMSGAGVVGSEVDVPNVGGQSPNTDVVQMGQQIVIGDQLQRDRDQRQVDEQTERTITKDDISSREDATIPEEERVRQRQEEASRRREQAREGNDFSEGPTREFPTGGSAVVGRGTDSAAAEEPWVVDDPTIGTEPDWTPENTQFTGGQFDIGPGAGVDQREDQRPTLGPMEGSVSDVRDNLDVWNRQDQWQDQRQDVAQDARLQQGLGLDLAMDTVGTVDSPWFAEPTSPAYEQMEVNEFADSYGYGTGWSGSPRRPRQPDPEVETTEEKVPKEYDPYAIQFQNPIASGASVLFGGGGLGVGSGDFQTDYDDHDFGGFGP
jgi:hypothetical protein